ncbi:MULTISPECIES: tail fiber assembly protein [Enterobacteriaceae]|uniref:Tail fiber assembly protein n=3 Tax=Escherichia TaxID=561 RepID=A0A8E4IS79_ESCFE|nr:MULTISPECIES: tail fiber assembly protein [Enterobacteriaceae]EAT0742557.1 tail fiber assembly protein [Salmonella enterica]EFB2714674.1 tail fiber assembly protein [Escherichia coli O157:H7]KAE9757618.1 tail fiber assembly protein [Enterobacteriaceae bacterium TzEc084]KAE9898591.1 tail fiber assembly protein [Enterobacteriaceae bacterium TzEc052]MVX79171.1 tail fiber assembly protein [Enterobacteriaceae bacterium 8376wD9]MVY29435.1 tail fiber assembly protein [Enterobacteriaceae bacterium
MSSIIYYSSINNAFYPEHLKQEYIKSNSFPADAKPVKYSVFEEFALKPAPEGKYRCVGEDGMPSWADIPPPTHEEQIAAAELKKQQLINQVNEYMNSKQWPGKAAIGRLKGEELAQYNLWLDYLDALEMVDTSSAPDIEWPTPPAVQAR